MQSFSSPPTGERGGIAGIGVDTATVARLEKSLARPGFLQRVYGPQEQAALALLSPAHAAQSAAAAWAAKEALGKALGCASGGYTAASRAVVALLRQKSRPYLFSNTLAPAMAGAALKTLELLEAAGEDRVQLAENTRYFRARMAEEAFDVVPGEHPIVAVMLYDAKLATAFAARMLELGVYVVGFCYPVVPQGKARIRVQLSAAHTREDLNFAVDCFKKVRAELAAK